MKKNKRIAVFGSSDCDERISTIAKKTGKLLSRNGVIVYCGERGGVMLSVCQGVKDVGGIVVGILPNNDVSESNQYVTIPIATGIGQARNVIIANSVQGAIAIKGSYGTLSEISHTLSQNKPVVTIDSWNIKGSKKVSTPEEAVETILDLI